MSTEAALIKLPFINGRTLTFSSTDYMKIREQHRIVGKLIGVPVTHSRKASCYSLPAYYNENETKLMLDEGIAVLVDKNQLKKAPSEIVKLEYEEHQKRVVEELQKPYIESKLEATRINMEHIIKGKIIKLVKSGVATEGIDINPENILKDEALRIKNSLGAKSICLQIPTQHPFQDNSSQLVSDYYVVSNPQKYKVFRDLWNKGFFITNGSSFGCDFLTYPGRLKCRLQFLINTSKNSFILLAPCITTRHKLFMLLMRI